jgi:uncharacterized protein with PIN domain
MAPVRQSRDSAALNLGDCCSYALSRISGEPLLARDHDFRKTDIRMVLQNTRPPSPKPRKKPN